MREARLFGDVRAVVHGTSDAMAWADLCTLLDEAEPEWYSQRLERYLIDTLSRWTDEVRVAPASWLVAACDGADVPWLRLVRHLALNDSILRACAPLANDTFGDIRSAGMSRINALDALSEATIMSFSSAPYNESPYLFPTLCEGEHYGALREFRFGGSYVREARRDEQHIDYPNFANSSIASGLERLHIRLPWHRSVGDWCEGLGRVRGAARAQRRVRCLELPRAFERLARQRPTP